MSYSPNNLDFRALGESLKRAVSQLGGFSPEQVKAGAVLGEELLKKRVLAVLDESGLTGAQILEKVIASASTVRKITSGEVYPTLANLVDLGLASSELVGERKVYRITADGRSRIAEEPAETDNEERVELNWLPTWIDLRGALAKSSGRLAKVVAEVAQHGERIVIAERKDRQPGARGRDAVPIHDRHHKGFGQMRDHLHGHAEQRGDRHAGDSRFDQ